MTAVARAELRQIFLEADLGISGVNFGVAESGSLCLVTNEGNGRMVTTLPRIHVALMGIERIVPTMDDLALMLELLPRSATGQKMTVYTTIINSPRKESDPDGPEQRHLVLVDNGRRAMRASPLAEGLLCIRCGACLNACPIFAEIGGHAFVNEKGETSTYPGPIGSIVSPGLFGQEEFGRFAWASTFCGACKDACPVDIDLPKLLLRVRAGGVTLNTKDEKRIVPIHVRFGMKFYAWMATNASRFSSGLKFAGYLSKIVSPRSEWLWLPGFTGWGFSKDLPRPSRRPFRARWAEGAMVNSAFIGSMKGRSETYHRDDIHLKTSPIEVDRIQRFSQELTTLSGEFTLCRTDQLGDRIVEQLQKLEVTSILSWDDKHLPAGLLDNLKAAGIRIVYEFNPDIRAGLTGAEAGIAETGTLVLILEKGKPQYVSLIPEIHFAVIEAKDIAGDIYQAIASDKLKQSFNDNLD